MANKQIYLPPPPQAASLFVDTAKYKISEHNTNNCRLLNYYCHLPVGGLILLSTNNIFEKL